MSADAPPPSLLRSSWRALKISAATAFVVWQLFFLCVRNPLDFWYKDVKKFLDEKDLWDADKGGAKIVVDPVDDWTTYYGDYVGIDQNWRMFSPPLARTVSFLAARVEFADGGREPIASESEPPDLHSYFRFGGWRQRKLEDPNLVTGTPGTLANDKELALWEAYALSVLKKWRERHPDDARGDPVRVVLLRRRFTLPAPNEDPTVVHGPESEDDAEVIGTFGPEGRLLP